MKSDSGSCNGALGAGRLLPDVRGSRSGNSIASSALAREALDNVSRSLIPGAILSENAPRRGGPRGASGA